jgi:hypothetical protein
VGFCIQLTKPPVHNLSGAQHSVRDGTQENLTHAGASEASGPIRSSLRGGTLELPPLRRSRPNVRATFLLEGQLGRILTGMKRWYLYLLTVPLGLVILAYLIVRWNSPINFADIWSRDNQAKNTQSDVGKMPDVNAVPKDVLKLRQAHQLRPLTEREDGTKIQDLPNGIYGFSMCSVVSLSAKRGNTFSLEIQKHDGIVYYVGYASDEDIEKYLTRQKNFHILTSPHSGEGASSLFEIPVEFVSKCEERPFKDGYLFDLFVTAIPELPT